jgi:hypothetical protein
MEKSLERAFRAAEYWVEPPGAEPLCLEIDQRSEALDALLAGAGARRWAIVTAWNPPGREPDDDANEVAQHALEQVIRSAGLTAWPGHNQAPDGTHREPTFVILELPADEAVSLGVRFGQAAVVAGELGGPARLLGCEPSSSRT